MTTAANEDAEGFITASLLQHILEAMRKRGIEIALVSQVLGVDLESYSANPDGRVPLKICEKLLHASQAFRPNHMAGLRAAVLENGTAFGAISYLIQTCATLDEMFMVLMRYERVVSDISITSMRHEPGIVLCCWDCTSKDTLFQQIATDFMFGSWLRHIHMIKGSTTQVLRAVHFRYKAPEDMALLREYEKFFGCPVLFDQPESALVLSMSAMQVRLRSPRPDLHDMLERHMRLMLAERPSARQSVVDKVRAILRVMLQQGNLSREQLASELGLSARQLHRQLQKAGSSYTVLVDELRLELAKTLLQEPALTVEAISQRLNFTESPSFVRWFRHKVGQTPGEYRHATAMSGR